MCYRQVKGASVSAVLLHGAVAVAMQCCAHICLALVAQVAVRASLEAEGWVVAVGWVAQGRVAGVRAAAGWAGDWEAASHPEVAAEMVAGAAAGAGVDVGEAVEDCTSRQAHRDKMSSGWTRGIRCCCSAVPLSAMQSRALTRSTGVALE